MKRNILIVDDEKSIRDTLNGILRDEGYSITLVNSGEEALETIKSNNCDIVLLDIWLDGIDGIEVLTKIKKQFPEKQVIMISGHGSIETAVKATKLGAYDFIEKPLSMDKILLTVAHAIKEIQLREENQRLLNKMKRNYELIGQSKAMLELKEQIKVVAQANSWILITGENGTGKELVARNIHMNSSRNGAPFVDINCAAIPEELIESELFGHEKGAFTGALSKKDGKFVTADKGTIFLDEIGDMSLKTQAKILRILQEHRFERVGGAESIEVDVRVIAATNKDLQKEMLEGRFRKDLYYRLNVIPFHIPPLRKRKEDIPQYIDYFLEEFKSETGKSKEISKDVFELLCKYNWPGNVRELKNLIERLVIMTSSDVIKPSDIPEYIKEPSLAVFDETFHDADNLDTARSRFEKEYITKKLIENNWNISKTAEIIKISRENLSRKIKGLNIKVNKGE